MKVRTSVGIIVFLGVFIAAPLQGQDRVAALNDAAWKMFNTGDTDGAATLFAQALVIRPEDPVLLLGAGAAAQRQGRPGDAMARLNRALDANPRFTPASLLLGEIAYRQGDVALAIRTYELALLHAPGDDTLTARLAEWRADAATVSASRVSFTVTLEGEVDPSTAERAADHLEESLPRIEGTLRAAPSGVLAVMLDAEDPVADTLRAPEWSEASYRGRIRVPAEGALRTPVLFERLLVHEVTHAMISSLAPRGVPAWLHEGLAQHFAGDDRAAARRRVAAAARIIPLHQLETSFAELDAATAQLAYDESLIAVQPLLDRADFRWTAFLGALGSARRVEDVLRQYGTSYQDIEHGLGRTAAPLPYRTSKR